MTHTSPFPKLFLFAAFCLAAFTFALCVMPADALDNIVASAYAQPSTHAYVGHGDEPDMIRRCLEDYGADAVLYNKCTCRTAFCVFVAALQKYGLWIEADDGANVTSFVKTKMNRLDQVIRYLNNAGYE